MEKAGYRKGVFIAAYALAEGKIEYLILRRKLHWRGWEFPKGGLEKGERAINGVKREIKEESGMMPLKIKKFNISGKYKYGKSVSDRENIIGQSYSLYAVEIKKEKIKIDKLEHSDYKWASFEESMKKLTWPNQKRCLKIINKWLSR